MFDISNSINVIPNFVNLNKYKPQDGKNNLLNDDNYIITHVSNFRKVKRIQDVIKIFDKISNELDAKLLMIGDGPERSKAEKLCKKLGIKGKVIFFGKSNETNEILSFSDLFFTSI